MPRVLRSANVSTEPFSLADFDERARAIVSAAEERGAKLVAEAEAGARDAQRVFAAQALGELSDDEADREMDSIHERSEALATLAKRMEVSPLLDPAHRYRLLAYNLLNQSNFESLMYLRTRDPEHQRRSDLLRSAFRKSLGQARLLAAALLGSEPED